MEKLNNILKNLYNSDSRIMLYIYIAIAVVTVILVLIIIISSIRTKKVNKLSEKEFVPNAVVPKLEPLKEEVFLQQELPIKEEKPLALTESVPKIKPIPVKEEVQAYDKPLELEPELDLTRPIQRVSTASDLLNEFLPNDNSINDITSRITSEDLNKPLLKKEEVTRTPEIYSSVFLDKKIDKPKIQLELTPINPLKIDKMPEPKVETKELILEPNILKPELPQSGKEVLAKANPKQPDSSSKEEPKNEVEDKKEKQISKSKEALSGTKNPSEVKEEPKTDESLDTKVDIFSHESLVQKNLGFDPFKPKTQEELLSSEAKTLEPEKPVELEKATKQESDPTVLSAEDLKNRLTLLQSKVNKKEASLDDVLRQVGLDDLSELYNEPHIEDTRRLSR